MLLGWVLPVCVGAAVGVSVVGDVFGLRDFCFDMRD